MQRERVADNIWVFTSSLFAQVTAGVVFTSEGAVVIDTLPYPSEAREMRDFARSRSLGNRGIRYVVLTHSHADHIYGAYLYPAAADPRETAFLPNDGRDEGHADNKTEHEDHDNPGIADSGIATGMLDEQKIIQKSAQTQNRAAQKEIAEERHG